MMQRSMLCYWLCKGWRWLLIPAAILISILTLFFAPVWLFSLLLALSLTVGAMFLIYLRERRELNGIIFLREPSPRDAHAEMVMVDAALLDDGPTLLSVAQPATPQGQLQPGQSGMLLLGEAMTLLSESLPWPDSTVLLQACEKQLSLHLPEVEKRYTDLHREREDDVFCVHTRTENGERTFLAERWDVLLPRCASILDGTQQRLGADDRTRITQAAAQMADAGQRLYAFAYADGDEAPTFIGMAALGDSIDPVGVAQLRELRHMGATIILRDDGTRQMDVPVLRRNLGIADLHARPDIHLCITDPFEDRHTLPIIRHDDRRLAQPVKALREHFNAIDHMLTRLSGLMGLCFLCCVLAGGVWSVPCCALVLATGYLSFGSLISARRIRPLEMIVTGVACLLIRLLMNSIAPQAQDAAGTLMCLTLTALLALLLRVPGRPILIGSLLPMLAVVLITIVIEMLCSLTMLPGILLPCLFGVICGLIIGLMYLLFRA